MKWKNKIAQVLTPKNTEQVKPNLFIQQLRGDSLMVRLDKTIKRNVKIHYPQYRQVHPVANYPISNRINYHLFLLGANPIKSFLIFIFILFLAYSYVHDINALEDIAIQMNTNITYYELYCKNAFNQSGVYLKDLCMKSNSTIFNINLTK